MEKVIRWDKEKNEILKQERGIGFEIVEVMLENGQVVDIINNPNYPNQQIFVLEIDDYMVLVPFVETKQEIFLKTLFRSRKHNKSYKGSQNEKKD